MALSINLNTCTTVDTKHTVSISAGSGVTASTTTPGFKTITNYVLTPNSGVEVTVATVTFTPSTSCYYIKEPTYKLKSTNKSAYNITETVVKDSQNRVTSKVFLIKYTNTVNSFGDLILFSHETEDLPATTNVYNNALIQINSFELETSDIASGGGVRSFAVKGSATARFNLKVTRSDGKTYDFSSTTFTSSATQLSDELIGSTGSFVSSLHFPSVSSDDVYTIELSPVVSKGTTLSSAIQDSTNDLKNTLTINQYKAITISLTSISSSYDGSYSGSPKYATTTFVGERNSTVRLQKNISFDFALSANSFTFARGYTAAVIGGMAELDFRSSVVKVKNGNQTAGVVVALDDINNIVEGMSITGTGVTGAPRVVSINGENKTVTVSVAQDAQGDGGMADDANLTFSYGGSFTSKAISGCEFEVLGLDEVLTGFLLNAATLTPVTTLVDGDVSSATIDVDSTAGIKAGSTTTVSGKGINSAAGAITVSSVTDSDTVVLSASQTLGDDTPLTFTGSSRSANLTFDFAITNFGTVDHTITINLDSILTVS